MNSEVPWLLKGNIKMASFFVHDAQKLNKDCML
jgi:hypothetical protein